jgi:hypothetical protein
MRRLSIQIRRVAALPNGSFCGPKQTADLSMRRNQEGVQIATCLRTETDVVDVATAAVGAMRLKLHTGVFHPDVDTIDGVN